MERPPLAMVHPPTIPLLSSPMIPRHMRLPQAHMVLPQARMELPLAHMELPQAHMELPQAHMELRPMILCLHTNQLQQVNDSNTKHSSANH